MSGASSLRNAVKRIAHKERAQPSDRKKLGLLEKHKDYVERATDFKKKKKYLDTLRKKASERNPDEFYFKMHNSKVKNGKHVDLSQTTNLDSETIKLLKTQDLGYIIHKKTLDEKKIDRLKANIHLIGDVHPKQHVIFAENEQQVADFDPLKQFDTVPELVDRHYNRLKKSQIEESHPSSSSSIELLATVTSAASQTQLRGKKRKQRSEELEEISERAKRAKKLTLAFEELSQQRNLARSKGARQKITVTSTVGRDKKEKEIVKYKWRRERAR